MEKDPPPTYESSISKIKKAKKESQGIADFCRRINQIELKSLLIKVLCGLCILLAIASIIIGAIYMNDCPAGEMIPVFLVIHGVLLFGSALVYSLMNYKSAHETEAAQDKRNHYLCGLLSVLSICLITWFTVGNAVVHNTKWTSSKTTLNITTPTNTTVTKYCHPVVYYYTFSFLMVSWFVLGCIVLYFLFGPVIRHLFSIIKENTRTITPNPNSSEQHQVWS